MNVAKGHLRKSLRRGLRHESAERLAQPLRELGTLVTDFTGRMPYRETQRLFDTQTPFGAKRCIWTSRFLTKGDIDGEIGELAIEIGKLVDVRQELDVPAELLDTRRESLELIDRQHRL